MKLGITKKQHNKIQVEINRLELLLIDFKAMEVRDGWDIIHCENQIADLKVILSNGLIHL